MGVSVESCQDLLQARLMLELVLQEHPLDQEAVEMLDKERLPLPQPDPGVEQEALAAEECGDSTQMIHLESRLDLSLCSSCLSSSSPACSCCTSGASTTGPRRLGMWTTLEVTGPPLQSRRYLY